jgi:hypothetical protein
MAVEMDLQSSGNRNSSDDYGEAADFSQSLHKKELLKRKYDDDDDYDGAFFQTESEGPPKLDSSSSGDNVQDHQAAGSRSVNTPRCNMKTESIKRFPVPKCSDELDGIFAVHW